MDTLDTKKQPTFSCAFCLFETHNKNSWTKHILTLKHLKCEKQTKMDTFSCKMYKCPCGKSYQRSQGLSKHKKMCKEKAQKNVQEMSKNVFLELLEQNKEIILDNKEFKEKLLEIASKPTNSTTIVNNNTRNVQNNKHFNLNFFLNETCKNAMNLSDFVQSLVIKNEEFEDMGKLGYVQGISNILIRGLKELDETERPMHCTDKKRETVYIKENNVWNKELSREKMKQLVLDVSFKNVRKIPTWKADHPGCEDASSYKYMDYVQILNQVMSGIHPDTESDINKIIRNVYSVVTLDKMASL